MRLTAICFVFVVLSGLSAAAQSEVQVGTIDPIKVVWGPQTIYAQITSAVDYPKFISAHVRIEFTGRYLNPKRAYRTNFLLEPGVMVSMPIKFEIPPNWGEAQISLEIYDVVDTLDDYFPDQKIAEEHSRLVFHVPEAMFSYLQERISMPPFTENSPLFDTELARLAFVMFRSGKDDRAIAELTKIDTIYLRQLMWKWKYYSFLIHARPDSALRPTFPIITTAEAEAVRPIAIKTANELAAMIQKNVKGYQKVVDSLRASGSLPNDSNMVLHGGTVLYQQYPVVTALLLWYHLGRGFVGGTYPLDIYRETDPCNTHIPLWMVAVQGGDLFNGHHFINFSVSTGKPIIEFADSIPEIRCPEVSPYADRLQGGEWVYAEADAPEFFTFDTTLVHPALRALSAGSEKILQPAYDSLRTIAERFEANSFVPGVNFWFWNLVATRTVDELTAKGVIRRRGNGHYRIESLQ
jgi:hypothetical protein